MGIEPKPGLVIRYDFLWDKEQKAGREDGSKDRPCVVVIVAPEAENESRRIWLCAITHSPLQPGQTGVEIPPRVSQHLGLDQAKSWIKTDEINSVIWHRGRVPPGISRTKPDQWTFGTIPPKLGRREFEQIRDNARKNHLARVQRG